jgi:hypothetical protein
MDAPAIVRLRFYVREIATSNARNVAKIAVYYRDFALLSDERRAEIVRGRRRYERLMAALIDEAKAEGAIRQEIPTKLAAANVLAQIVWPYTWYQPGGRVSPETLGETVADLALCGLA